MINTSYIDNKNFSFMGKNNLKTNPHKKIILEESLDEFVSTIIKKEREASGEIYNYKQNLSSKDLKKIQIGIKRFC
ncbi:MAG: hypothetical protein MJ230_05480 [bacterium]|nr:hypothetical protein [bacterium]